MHLIKYKPKKSFAFILGAVIAFLFLTESSNMLFWKRQVAAIPSRQIEIEVQKVVPVLPVPSGITNETVALFVPTDIAPTTNAKVVQAQILDHSIQSAAQGKFIRNAEIINTAKQIQEAMKPSFSFGESTGGIQHKIDMQIEAFQSVAKLNYTGFINSEVVYKKNTEEVDVSVYDKVTDNTKISFEHKSKNDLSLVNLRWDW